MVGRPGLDTPSVCFGQMTLRESHAVEHSRGWVGTRPLLRARDRNQVARFVESMRSLPAELLGSATRRRWVDPGTLINRHNSRGLLQNGVDQLSNSFGEHSSLEGVDRSIPARYVDHLVDDQGHQLQVLADDVQAIVCCVGAATITRRPLARSISTCAALGHRLDNVRKVVDLRLLVLPALQTVALFVRRLPTLLRAPATRPPTLLRRHTLPAPLTQPRLARLLRPVAIAHDSTRPRVLAREDTALKFRHTPSALPDFLTKCRRVRRHLLSTGWHAWEAP